MNIERLNHDIKKMYSVNEVELGYNYWFFKLLGLVIDMFEYEGLPTGLNKRELELNLIMTGHAAVIKKSSGQYFSPLSNLYGYDENYQPTWMVFANPVVLRPYQYTIGKDTEVIYNSSLKDSIYYVKADTGLSTFISRYARQLADIEATINIYTVNSRLISIPVTNDNAVKNSIILFFKNLILGKRAIVSDSSIVEKFRNIDINRSNIKDGVNDWLLARDKVLEQFYRDLGVKMNNQKKAQVNEEEVEANDQLLLINTHDMLEARKEGLEKINELFGLNISVKLNPLFDVQAVRESAESEVTDYAETYAREISL